MLPKYKQTLYYIAERVFKEIKEPLFELMRRLDYSDDLNINDLADQVIFYGYENNDLYQKNLKSFIMISITDFSEAKYELKKQLVKVLAKEYEFIRNQKLNDDNQSSTIEA